MATSKTYYPTWWIILLGSITAIGPLTIDMYLPALPQIASSYAVTTEAAAHSVTFYFLGLVFGQLIYGPVSDRYGRKKPLYVGLGLYVLATAVCAIAPTLEVLIPARVLQAVGGCAGVVMARAAIRDKLPTVAMAQAFSTLIMVMGVAPILAPSLGDLVLQFMGWRGIFWVLVLVGLLNLACVHWFFDDTLPSHKRKKTTVIQAMVSYQQILKDKRFTLPAVASGALLGALFVYINASAGLMMEHFGLTSRQYSWVFGVNSLGFVIMSQINVRLIRHMALEKLFIIAALLQLACMLILLVCVLAGMTHFWLVLALLFVAIATVGVTAPNGTAMAMAHQAERAGIASSMLGSLRFFMGVLGGGLLYLLSLSILKGMVLVMLLLVGGGVLCMLWFQRENTSNTTF